MKKIWPYPPGDPNEKADIVQRKFKYIKRSLNETNRNQHELRVWQIFSDTISWVLMISKGFWGKHLVRGTTEGAR